MNKKLLLTAAIVSSLFFAGCRSSVPIHNVTNAPIQQPNSLSLQQVEIAIIQAGDKLGWKVEKVTDGKLLANLQLRTHQAKVAINYSTSDYNIIYQDSHNLQYRRNTNIHPSYNRWIANLDKAIKNNLSVLAYNNNKLAH